MNVSMKCHCCALRLAKRPCVKFPAIVVAQVVQRTPVTANSPLQTGHCVGSGYSFCCDILELLNVCVNFVQIVLHIQNSTDDGFVNRIN
jgi:hypothetical protein